MGLNHILPLPPHGRGRGRGIALCLPQRHARLPVVTDHFQVDTNVLELALQPGIERRQFNGLFRKLFGRLVRAHRVCQHKNMLVVACKTTRQELAAECRRGPLVGSGRTQYQYRTVVGPR